jgi:divalent metal cation (Fe/Co/Zn/Cd) transporter
MAAERERLMAIDEPALRTSEQSGALLRRGRILEGVTLGWNVAGIAVLAVAAVAARSVALAGFGLDSLIEIGASTVVLWELSGSGEERQRRALRLIGGAFVALAAYLTVQSVLVLATGYRPGHSVPGIAWTAVTAAVMFALSAGKARTGKALGNPVLVTEGRVTLVDGILATAVLTGLALNAAAGWWWADPPAALVIVVYALREAREIFLGGSSQWLARFHALTFAAQRHHGSHQVQQRPGQVVLGGHDHVVVHPDVVDGDARGRAVRHRDTNGASGEILP